MSDLFNEVERNMNDSFERRHKSMWRTFFIVAGIMVVATAAFWVIIALVFGPYVMRAVDAGTRALENVAVQTEPARND